MINEEMTNEEIFNELIAQALEGKHTPFEFIRNFSQLLFALDCRRDRKNLLKLFQKLEKDFIKEYTNQIRSNSQDINLVTSIKQLATVKDYYIKEVNILSDMVSEYKAYVLNGHITDTILGIERAEEDLYDFRF